MKNKTTIILGLILLAGLFLRLWGINFGLPYLFHQDEPIVVNHAIAYGTGDLNPHFFIIPPLTSYIVFAFYILYYLVLSLFGQIKGTEAFALSFLKDPGMFYLIGRIVVGFVPSMISVYLTYRLALRLASARAALFSALIMAVSFINVINGHYLYTDNLLVMAVLLATLQFFRLAEKPVLKNYIFSGCLIGLAVAVKYNSAMLIAAFGLAHILAVRDKKVKLFNPGLLLCLLFAILVFIICNPFSLLDWRYFSTTGSRIRHAYIGWSHHFIYSLIEGIGILPVFLGLAGLLLAVKKYPSKALILISFPALFYLHLVFTSQVFSRYVLALVPFLAIGAGLALFEVIFPKYKHSLIVILASSLVMLPTLIKAIKADLLFIAKDTRAESAEWIEKNIPPGTKIAMDHTFFRPQIKQSISQIREKEIILNQQSELRELKNKKFNLLLKTLSDSQTYEIYYLVEGREKAGMFLGFWPVIKNNLEELAKCGIQYVVFDNMNSAQSMKDLRSAALGKFILVAEFSPYYDNFYRLPYDTTETTCLTMAGRELFSRKKPGPFIQIYKIR